MSSPRALDGQEEEVQPEQPEEIHEEQEELPKIESVTNMPQNDVVPSGGIIPVNHDYLEGEDFFSVAGEAQAEE